MVQQGSQLYQWKEGSRTPACFDNGHYKLHGESVHFRVTKPVHNHIVSSRLENRCLKVLQISLCFLHWPFVTALLMFCPRDLAIV